MLVVAEKIFIPITLGQQKDRKELYIMDVIQFLRNSSIPLTQCDLFLVHLFLVIRSRGKTEKHHLPDTALTQIINDSSNISRSRIYVANSNKVVRSNLQNNHLGGKYLNQVQSV